MWIALCALLASAFITAMCVQLMVDRELRSIRQILAQMRLNADADYGMIANQTSQIYTAIQVLESRISEQPAISRTEDEDWQIVGIGTKKKSTPRKTKKVAK